MAHASRTERSSNAPSPKIRSEIHYDADLLAGGWSRKRRVALSAAGGMAIAGAALVRNSRIRQALLLLGAASVARSVLNQTVTELVGVLVNPAIRLSRGVRIEAPPSVVFEFLSNFSNYSKFMSYVEDVCLTSTGELDWRMRGPAGIPLRWRATLAEFSREQAISWKSVPGSLIRNSGRILLSDTPGGATRVQIQLSYAIPAGALGVTAIRLFGFDPRDRIDHDLRELKRLIEIRNSAGLEID